jgi:hypothetical protein
MIKIILTLLVCTGALSAAGLQDYQFISPKPGSEFNTRESTIIIRQGSKIDPGTLHATNLVQVGGSISGPVSGQIILSSDGKTVIFKPDILFAPNEKVMVSVNSGLRTISDEKVNPISFSFRITSLIKPLRPDFSNYDDYDKQDKMYSNITAEGKTYHIANGDTLPEDFPEFIITGTGETAPGMLFGGNSSTVDTIGSYSMILENSGIPVYYEPNVGGGFDLHPNGLISYAKALGPKHAFIYMVKDQNYALIDSFQMGNGYIADSHDFLLLPNGHAIMLAYDTQPIDMSQIIEGGQPNATVTGSIIQELDVDKNVVYQWRCWDYIPITDSYKDITKSRFDYIHVNSVELDNDGNIILSCRETWDVIKISRVTGEVIWRMNGKQNEFTFINEHEENAPHYFKLQHSVRRLPNGNLTIFDNGADKDNTQRTYSRAVEYALDEENKTLTMVWEYRHEPDILAFTGGTVQRLPNGNTLISWGGAISGGAPAVTEVTTDGTIAFELSYTEKNIGGGFTRHPWYGSDVISSVTYNDVRETNIYDFSEGDSIQTGTTIEITTLPVEDYNQLTVTKTDYGPLYPQFAGRAPMVLPIRIVVSNEDILSMVAIISFDIEFLEITDPDSIIIYHREFEGEGFFIPLLTSYNPITGELSATMDRFGEFIFGYPDFKSVAYAPKLLFPADSASVNQTLPVELTWAPIGYFNMFNLQVATNLQFTDPMVEEENLTNMAFTLDTVDTNKSHFWRVKSVNDAGESDWSEAYMFSTTAPNITIQSPNGGEEYQRGLRYFIQWNDNIFEDVVIELHRNGESAGIIDTVSSSGSYRWSINPYLPTDTTYMIFIKSLQDTNLFDISDTYFAIIDTVSTPISEDQDRIVSRYQLYQNYPNPFNPKTIINYELAIMNDVELSIYNLLGQKVAILVNQRQNAGFHQVEWDATGFSSGIYYYKLNTGEFQQVKKMVLIK